MTGYGALAAVYDSFTGNVGYEMLARRIDGALKSNDINNGIVLDAGCGTGTLTLLLAKHGYDMIGVDASEDMLAVAAQKLRGREIPLLCQRLESLDLYGTVRGIVCTLDTLNHIESERALNETFRRFSLFCEPGGVLLFDANTPYKHKCVLADNAFVFEDERRLCVWRNEYQAAKKRVALTADVFIQKQDGAHERQTDRFCEYDREPALFDRLLKKHRFRLLSATDFETGGVITATTQRVWFCAVKEEI